MKYKLVIRSCAETDISTSVIWYEKKRKGLGKSFQKFLDATFRSIIINPESFPLVYKKIRRALIKKFPYSIFYCFDNNIIIVLAVYHEKRDPNNWKSRVKQKID